MIDRRQRWSDGHVAHVSLRGRDGASRFVEGEARIVATATAPIAAAPGGPRERELCLGEGFTTLVAADGHAFGFAVRDGYAGYMPEKCLAPQGPQTHMVVAPRSYGKARPGLKDTSEALPLSFGSRLQVTDSRDGWAEVALPGPFGAAARQAFVPAQHLAPADHRFGDPVAVAELFLGTPYLWGGNSAFGIDCSGLVQAALLACGLACPGDSDQQQAMLGDTLPEGARPARGDLLFWRGHVALVAGPDRIVHANAHHMAVAREGLTDAVARIDAQGDGRPTRHARLRQEAR